MATTLRRITCLGCDLVFKFRSLDAVAKRIGLHKCWSEPKPFKTYADTGGEPDRDWRPSNGAA